VKDLITRDSAAQVVYGRYTDQRKWGNNEIANELFAVLQDIRYLNDAPYDAIDAVLAERQRQDAKWGQQNHDPVYWLGILGEEFGELCQAINETVFDNGPEERKKGGYTNMRAEAVQVAAVAVAFVEMLDRRYGEDVARG